jgi:TRAP-type C4-dicarboxylate transport system permease small subunit
LDGERALIWANGIDRALSWLSKVLLVLGAVALLLMAAHVTLDVLGRLTLARPIYGTTEIVSFYYMVAAVCLPLAYIELKDEHITVDVLYMQMPRWLKRAVFVFACLMTAGFFGIFAYQSWLDALRATATREVVMGHAFIEIWPSRYFLPVSFALLVVATLLRAVKALITSGDPESATEAVVD